MSYYDDGDDNYDDDDNEDDYVEYGDEDEDEDYNDKNYSYANDDDMLNYANDYKLGGRKNNDEDKTIDENDDDEIIEGNDGAYISSGPEWRDFGDGEPSKSRVGIARSNDIDEDLSLAYNVDFKHLEKLNKTPEDIYKYIVLQTIDKYRLDKNLYDTSLKILKILKQKNIKIKYKNPKAILFAIMCVEDKKINMQKLKELSDKIIDEKIGSIDLLRYCFLIQDFNI